MEEDTESLVLLGMDLVLICTEAKHNPRMCFAGLDHDCRMLVTKQSCISKNCLVSHRTMNCELGHNPMTFLLLVFCIGRWAFLSGMGGPSKLTFPAMFFR